MEGRNYCLTLAYDGTGYKGWQRLPNGADTVQGRLEGCLSRIFGVQTEVSGSGRTDAGVHAKAQVVSFRGPEMPPEKLLAQLRHALPSDIGALSVCFAPERFHARLSATEKTYVYRIWNSELPDVFGRRYRLWLPGKLDAEAMELAASALLGRHDFLAFCANKHMKKSTVRELRRLEITRQGEELRICLTADGFLYHMVRIIVGTLLEIGQGKRDASSIPQILESRKREQAGETAPAKGLCLEEVRYGGLLCAENCAIMQETAEKGD